jgi:hypothetical protein
MGLISRKACISVEWVFLQVQWPKVESAMFNTCQPVLRSPAAMPLMLM